MCVGEHIYAVLPKGPMNEGHLLIVPIHHHKSMRCIQDSQVDIINEVKELVGRGCECSQASGGLVLY